MPAETLSIADLYLRKSSADGGKSVSQQDDECSDGIDMRGWNVGRRFTDDNRSASRYARKPRERYEELVAHIRAGQCQILAMWETGRGGRREVTYFQLLELCREMGTRIYIFTHDRLYDLARRSDWRALAQEVIDSADLSGKISEGSQRGKRRLAMTGKPAGKVLYGYAREYDPTTGAYVRQVAHPDQAPIVKRMATELIKGDSGLEIARRLNTEGIPTAMGAQWRGRDVSRLLRNPAYVRGRIHKGVLLPSVEGDWPAILDEDTWKKCYRKLSDSGRVVVRETKTLKWYLTGVPRCGREDCDGVLRTARSGGAHRYECSCSRVTVKALDLEGYIDGLVKARLAKPDAKDLFLPRGDDHAVRVAEQEAAELGAELQQWRELAKARKVSAASFVEIEAGLLPKLAAAESKARSLAGPPPLPELEGVDVGAQWAELSPHIRREVVRLLMTISVLPARARGARFTPERVRIDWKGRA